MQSNRNRNSRPQIQRVILVKTFGDNSPAAQGYRMPAEWEPHEATWLSWPRREGISFPDAYDEVMPVFVRMIDALRESEQVRINVIDHDHEQHVRLVCSASRALLSFSQYFTVATLRSSSGVVVPKPKNSR